MKLFERIKNWTETAQHNINNRDDAVERLRELEFINRDLLGNIDTENPMYQFTPNLSDNLKFYMAKSAKKPLDRIDAATYRALINVFRNKTKYDLTINPYPERVKARNDDQLKLCLDLSTQKKLPIEELSDKELDITILLVTYNQLQMTKECIESIFEFTNDVNFEVILIDNGSTDGSYEYFSNDKRINCIRLPYNIGCLLAIEVFYHSGLDRGKFWMYMNNDVVVAPRWASNMLSCIKSDPAIGLVMPTTNRQAEFLMTHNLPFDLFDIESAKKFGDNFNQSNPALWEDKTILYAFVGLNRPSARRLLGYYEDAYYYPFYYADGDASHSMKLAGYRLILQRDTYVHHLDGGSSMRKRRRLMLDRGENDFFNRFGYFPSDVEYSLPKWAVDEKIPRKILYLGFARANSMDELIHIHRIWSNYNSDYFSADTCEKLKMDNLNPNIHFVQINSWYEIDKIFPGETFDLIVFPEPVQTMRHLEKFIAAIKYKLSINGQFICYWENPINILNLRYYYITRRYSLRDACRLIKKCYAPLKDLIQTALRTGLYVETMHEYRSREDSSIYGLDMRGIAQLCDINADDTSLFVDRLKTTGCFLTMRNWIPIDEDKKKSEMRKNV